MSHTLIHLLDPQDPWMVENPAIHGNEHQCVNVTGGAVEEVHAWVQEAEIGCRVVKYYDYNGTCDQMVLLFPSKPRNAVQAQSTNDDFLRFKMAWSGQSNDFQCHRLNQWTKV